MQVFYSRKNNVNFSLVNPPFPLLSHSSFFPSKQLIVWHGRYILLMVLEDFLPQPWSIYENIKEKISTVYIQHV